MAGDDHQAELARESKGRKRALYMRCQRCGQIHARLDHGQALIQRMIQNGTITLYDPDTAAESAAFEAGEDARERQETEARRTGGGFFYADDSELE
jgi:hypothetical protein